MHGLARALVAVAFGLVLLEGAVRALVALPPVHDALANGPGAERRPTLRWRCADLPATWDALRHDADLGWSPVPGQAGLVGSGEVRHDARGFRAVPGTGRGARVVLLGDSFTYGVGVADAETFAAVLGRRRPDLEVVNLGVPGFSHEQMWLRWRRDGAGLGADVVVLGDMELDVDRDGRTWFGKAKPWAVLGDGGVAVQGVPVPTPRAACEGWRVRPWSVALATWTWQGGDVDPPTPLPARRALAHAVLDALRTEVEATGARFVVLRLPLHDEIRGEPPGRDEVGLARWAGARGVTVIDPTPALAEAMAGGASLELDGHYDAQGNRLVGEALADGLGALLPPP